MVKPASAAHPAVQLVVNSITEYVLPLQESGKMALPDFIREGPDLTYSLDQAQGTARLVNEGSGKIRFTIGELTPPGLLIIPEDTPKELAGRQTQVLKFHV